MGSLKYEPHKRIESNNVTGNEAFRSREKIIVGKR